jgi:ADP-ribose pyrophosphatase YjhB (NUDIX family)
MIDFTIGGSRFFYRAAAVAIQDEHVLLHQIDENQYWTLPGERVEFGETSSEALIREMQEELGQEVHVDRLLWTVESFLEDGGKRLHAIGHYYAISFQPLRASTSTASHSRRKMGDPGSRSPGIL